MELRFEDQAYQLAAVDAVVKLFEGQPRIESSAALLFSESGISAVANHLDLHAERVLENLRDVQVNTGLRSDDLLRCIQEVIETEDGPVTGGFPNFSVEMETGTGKTYTYIRTALELARRRGGRVVGRPPRGDWKTGIGPSATGTVADDWVKPVGWDDERARA